MTNLSPATQAVLDATWREMDYAPDLHLRWAAAAALRAAADQVVPEGPHEYQQFTNEALRLNRMGTRQKLLAIAAELEANEL